MLVTSIWGQKVREMEAAGHIAPALRNQKMINVGQIAQKNYPEEIISINLP